MLIASVFLSFFPLFGASLGEGRFLSIFTISFAIMMVGMILISMGFYGYYHNYGSKLGWVTSISFLGTATLYGTFLILRAAIDFERTSDDPLEVTLLISFIATGISMTLGSTTIVWWRYPSGAQKLGMASGLMGMTTAAAFFTIILPVFGIAYWTSVASCALFLLVFYKIGSTDPSGWVPTMGPSTKRRKKPEMTVPPLIFKENTQRIICPKCQRPFEVDLEAKSVICPYCGERGDVEPSKVLLCPKCSRPFPISPDATTVVCPHCGEFGDVD